MHGQQRLLLGRWCGDWFESRIVLRGMGDWAWCMSWDFDLVRLMEKAAWTIPDARRENERDGGLVGLVRPVWIAAGRAWTGEFKGRGEPVVLVELHEV